MRVLAMEIRFEHAIPIAEFDRTDTLRGTRDQQTSERRINDRIRHDRPLTSRAVGRGCHPSPCGLTLINTADRSVSCVVDRSRELVALLKLCAQPFRAERVLVRA